MRNMPVISVLMPVYNAELYLRQAIDSILSQHFEDFELLIFNDGSKDSSKEIIQSFCDPRIHLIDFENNQGYVTLLNLGLRKARGKYIARMDADDIAHPYRFQKQYEFLEQNKEYILCGTNFKIVDRDQIVKLPSDDEEIKLKLLYINAFCHPSVMFRASTIREKRILYSTAHMPFEDYELWVRISELGKLKNLQEVLLCYRIHDKNISLKQRTKTQQELKRETQIGYIREFFRNMNFEHSEELTLHKLFHKNSGFTRDELKSVGKLVRSIIDKSTVYPVSTRAVHDLLISMYFYRCTTSTHIGLHSFILANQFKLKGISFFQNLKLLIKAVFKYKSVIE
ncbi:glycosyltransferase family 2 protein [Ohtaekwangia kribbensis]|uniref:Glycosyltransferase family 2 protein n=1 Tax=Ohtaekwangia kribbensis TaxID=688913 RepID=A0ABW3K1H1_9BACT